MQLKLTSKERLVLYGLARYPGLSDIDLANKIGVDRSTIFKSKRKFRDWQLIKLLNVPSGLAIGAELLTAVFIKLSPRASAEALRNAASIQSWIDHSQCVFHTSTDVGSVSIIYSRSLTEFKKNFEPLMDDFRRNNFVEEISCYHYPLALTSYSADAAMAVDGIFSLRRSDLPEKLPSPGLAFSEDTKLTDKDKLTLYSFVKYPMLSDLELSRRTGISRPTISGKRSRFFQSGLLSREAYIDWQKICCELLAFYHVDLRYSAESEVLSEIHNALRGMGAPLFTYLQPGEAFGAFLSVGYSDLLGQVETTVRSLAEKDLLGQRPQLMIMPLSKLVGRKMDYAPMVAKMLEIGKEI